MAGTPERLSSLQMCAYITLKHSYIKALSHFRFMYSRSSYWEEEVTGFSLFPNYRLFSGNGIHLKDIASWYLHAHWIAAVV